MAFYDQYGFSPSTYESCSTGAFKHGRTETVRSASSETAEFAKAFVQENKPSRDDLQKLLQSVSAKHNKLTREAALGKIVSLCTYILMFSYLHSCGRPGI